MSEQMRRHELDMIDGYLKGKYAMAQILYLGIRLKNIPPDEA